MPAVSKSQQRLMGMAYAVSKFQKSNGKEGLNPNDLDKDLKDTIMDIVNNMKVKDLEKFAKTDHKNLPDKKNESCLYFKDFILTL